MPRAALATALLALAACRGAAPEVSLLPLPGLPTAAEFPGADALLAGFGAADGDEVWRAGDEVLFGLRLQTPGTVRRWLLHLRLSEPAARARDDDGDPGEALPRVEWSVRVNGAPQPFDSALCRCRATVCDADGAPLGRSEPLLPRDFLAHGFTAACQLVADRQLAGAGLVSSVDFYRQVDVRPFAAATVAAVALLQVVQEDDVLAPLLWEVVEAPSWWSVLTHFGARVLMRPRFHAAVRLPSPVPAAGATAWRVPLALLVNGAPALDTELYVVPSAAPVALCGGIVAAVARSPQRQDREFAMVLLGARRGEPAPAGR